MEMELNNLEDLQATIMIPLAQISVRGENLYSVAEIFYLVIGDVSVSRNEPDLLTLCELDSIGGLIVVGGSR
jgi:hypothetical protein